MTSLRYIFKSDIDSYYSNTNNDDVTEAINTFLMPFESLKYVGNLNKQNEQNGILLFFFINGMMFGFAQLESYNKTQIKRFKLPDRTYELQDVFIFEDYRGRRLCNEMLRLITESFPDFVLKVTFHSDDNIAERCYRRFFESYDTDSKNIEFLVDTVWKIKPDKFKVMLRY